MENTKIAEILEKYKDFIATLPEELQEKARACTTEAELLALTSEVEGELPDEVMEAVAGGCEKDAEYQQARPETSVFLTV